MNNDEESHNNMFIVLSSLKSGASKNVSEIMLLMFEQDYNLKKGDILKLGRIKFKVKDMRTENQPAYSDMPRGMSLSPAKKSYGLQKDI